MGTKFEVDNSGNVDIKNNQVKNVGRLGLQNQSSDPGSPAEGQLYYNSTSKKLRVHNGTAFADVGGGNTAMTPTGSSGTTHSFKNPDFSLFMVGKGASGQDGGPNINCPGGLVWPKAGGIGFGTVLGQWCSGFVTTANTSFGWTYNVASSVLSQMNYSGAYILLGWDKKDKGSTPSDVVLRASENTTSLATVNPVTGFDTFGSLFATTELDSFTDATEKSISNSQGSGVTRFSQYILKVSNLTKNTLCAIAALRTGAGSFTTSQAELFLWNFNTSTWDKTISTFAAGECQSGGNGGFAGGSQNVLACLVAKDATNYKSSGIAYVRIVLTAPQPGGASASVSATGYIGLVQADDYKET